MFSALFFSQNAQLYQAMKQKRINVLLKLKVKFVKNVLKVKRDMLEMWI